MQFFTRILPEIRPGITELAIAAEIDHEIKRRGGSGPSFETIVASGPRSAWAHARPTLKALAKNELVVLDQGAILRSYCSDMTRTVFLGRASQKVQSLYYGGPGGTAGGQASHSTGSHGWRGGQSSAQYPQTKRTWIAISPTVWATGLGLEVHEMPRLGKGEQTVLEEGMVLTVEPGVYLEGVGGIRIEDDVVVTANGCTDLTTAPREFLEL